MSLEATKALHDILIRTGTTIAAAESLTTGLVQSHLGFCSGSSAYYKGGVTAYSLDAKVKLLGVDRKHAEQVNCVSAVVARQMAAGVRDLFGTDIGIATTGYAEPDPGLNVDVPFAWVGFNVLGCYWEERIGPGPADMRAEVQDVVASQAIDRLVHWFAEVKSGMGYDQIPAVDILLNRGL